MNRREFRSSVLFDHGASLETAAELLEYNKNPFEQTSIKHDLHFPLDDELHVETWERYTAEAEEMGAFATLQKRLVQLQFPIREGISQTEAYRAATRRGTPVNAIPEATGLHLKQPSELRLLMYQSLAGTIPVIITNNRDDFIALLQALAKRNEPSSVPDSMGACIISGYINWDRIRELNRIWKAEDPPDRSVVGWSEELFQRILPHKVLYQDRFILICDGPYSNVAAKDMGFSESEWQQVSMTLRLEHECTHYLTRRIFNVMRNNALDELLADYRGIIAANKRYRVDWFLRFIGLEDFPDYHEGGRLENYRGEPPISDEAFAILQSLVKDAAENLEDFDRRYADELIKVDAQGHLMMALYQLTLEEFASRESDAFIQQARRDFQHAQEAQP